ncbi:unnamed protein product [Rotaria sp. Silwood1]|nr:unnamed protein product [Rotaria sp. Silwood1]
MNNSLSIDSISLRIDTIKSRLIASWSIIYLVFGSFGTFLNVIVFTRRTRWSSSPCIPYLLASSLSAIPVMYATILSRIGIGFQIIPFYYSSILCKLLVYISNVSLSLIIWFTIGSCWDRYLSSSRNALIRQMNSIRNTRQTILIIIFCVLLAYAQILYCYEANIFLAVAPCAAKTAACTIVDSTFLFVVQYVTPPLVISYFGICIFLNVRQSQHQTLIQNINNTQTVQTRNNQRAERIVLRMVIIQVITLLMCSFPTLIFRVYITITTTTAKSSLRRSVENLSLNITFMIYYVDKVCSFYVYTMTSGHFRKTLWQFINRIYSGNTVLPETQQ